MNKKGNISVNLLIVLFLIVTLSLGIAEQDKFQLGLNNYKKQSIQRVIDLKSLLNEIILHRENFNNLILKELLNDIYSSNKKIIKTNIELENNVNIKINTRRNIDNNDYYILDISLKLKDKDYTINLYGELIVDDDMEKSKLIPIVKYFK